LEQLQSEITELREILRNLNSIITSKSFTSADQLFSISEKHEKASEQLKEDEYFQDTIEKKKFKDTKIKRKIFSDEEKEKNLLAILTFNDMDNLIVKFFNPKDKNIKETSEKFIKVFLKDALIHIKETNPEIDIEYDFYKSTEFIEKVTISNLQSVEEFDLITQKVKELLE
jgi:hypothetical protein